MEDILFMIFNNIFLFMGTLFTVAIVIAWISTKLESEFATLISSTSIAIAIVYLIFQ